MATKQWPGNYDCYAAAAPDEPIFILRANDELAPWIVRIWAATRERNPSLRQAALVALDEAMDAKGKHNVAKIEEAYSCASAMEAWLRSQAPTPSEGMVGAEQAMLRAQAQYRNDGGQ